MSSSRCLKPTLEETEMFTMFVHKTSVTRLLMLSALALSVTGCKHSESSEQVLGWSMVEPTQRHPIMITQAPANLDIEVSRGRPGLAPEQRASVIEFLRRYKRESTTGKLVIAAPGGAPNEVSAVTAAGIVKGLARSEGIGWNEIQVDAYSGEEGNPQPPLRLSFVRHSAEAPDCGRFPANLAEEPKNLPYANLGCASQRNLAAMVANPQDLLGPRTEQTARNAARRDVIMDKWIKGDATAAQRGSDEKAKAKNQE
jgi:pilus assembly protein CpaD